MRGGMWLRETDVCCVAHPLELCRQERHRKIHPFSISRHPTSSVPRVHRKPAREQRAAGWGAPLPRVLCPQSQALGSELSNGGCVNGGISPWDIASPQLVHNHQHNVRPCAARRDGHGTCQRAQNSLHPLLASRLASQDLLHHISFYFFWRTFDRHAANMLSPVGVLRAVGLVFLCCAPTLDALPPVAHLCTPSEAGAAENFGPVVRHRRNLPKHNSLEQSRMWVQQRCVVESTWGPTVQVGFQSTSESDTPAMFVVVHNSRNVYTMNNFDLRCHAAYCTLDLRTILSPGSNSIAVYSTVLSPGAAPSRTVERLLGHSIIVLPRQEQDPIQGPVFPKPQATMWRRTAGRVGNGVYYTTLGQFDAQMSANVSKLIGAPALSVEDVVRSGGTLQLADILERYKLQVPPTAYGYNKTMFGVWPPEAQAYTSRPVLGYKCIYRARRGEVGWIPDCSDIESTLKTHATELYSAGVDFVVVRCSFEALPFFIRLVQNC